MVNGRDETEGRVEIYLSGRWGTVCDDFWDINDANVVCRQLGFLSAREAVPRAAFGGGFQHPLYLDNVHCVGNETSLADCPANPIGRHNCGHGKDAGVRCNQCPAGNEAVYHH